MECLWKALGVLITDYERSWDLLPDKECTSDVKLALTSQEIHALQYLDFLGWSGFQLIHTDDLLSFIQKAR